MPEPTLPKVVRLGDGAVASLMRSHDWSRSPLGDPSSWPRSLGTIASLVLNSKFPMFVAWGPQLALIYNDAYVEMLADKHPDAIGQPLAEVWPEIWHEITPIVEQAMAGESSYYEDLPLLMHRKGYDEQTWFTFSYSPVHDDDGNIAGIYCACTETTQQVLAARHRTDENERLRHLFQQAPGIMAVLCQPGHIF